MKGSKAAPAALRFQGTVDQLEQAGKEENVDYIRENHPLLLQMYHETCESISTVIMI